MRFSSPIAKLAPSCLLAALVAAGGCFGDGESGPGGYAGSGAGPNNPASLDIDTGATIMAMGGQGVGIFVEYASGGAWTVFTACDTNISQQNCDIDVYVAPVDSSASISNFNGVSFQGMDEIDVQSNGVVHMFVETTTGLDGMTFSATPGAAMQFEVLLGGQALSQYIYWVGDGVLHTGSPTDPVNFTPVAPDGGAGGSGPDGGEGGGGGDAGTGGGDAGTGGGDAGTDGGA